MIYSKVHRTRIVKALLLLVKIVVFHFLCFTSGHFETEELITYGRKEAGGHVIIAYSNSNAVITNI